MKLPRALTTALSAAALVITVDMLWVLAAEREQPLGYFALTAALLAVVAATTGALLSRLKDSSEPTAAMIAALGASILWGTSISIFVGLTLFYILRRVEQRETDPILLGVATATGLCMSAIFAPRVILRVPSVATLPETVRIALLAGLLISIIAGTVLIAQRLFDGRATRLISSVLAAGLIACAVVLPIVGNEGSRSNYSQPSLTSPGVPPKPHVLLIVLDTVRADHLTLYGYERPTTPKLGVFVTNRPKAIVHPSIYANSNWTVPSHASLFTGLEPASHGAHFSPGNQFSFGLGDHPTLAERMQDAGYYTIGVYANPWLSRVSGMDRGFDVYGMPWVGRRLPIFGEAARRALLPGAYPGVHDLLKGDLIVADIERELRACGDTPCFAFANLTDAHGHYVADSCRGKFAKWSLRNTVTSVSVNDSREQTDLMMARYDEELCELDRILTEMLQTLESTGILDHTWVFITSDHGEAFGEHGSVEHGSSAYNEQVWVPLIVFPPTGQSISADEQPGSLIDITATIAAIGSAEEIGAGRDLRRPGATGALASTTFYGDPSKTDWTNPRAADPARAVVVGNMKLVEQSGRIELFDLEADPTENTDLSAQRPDLVVRLESLLPNLALHVDTSVDDQVLPPEVLEQLRELGYGR